MARASSVAPAGFVRWAISGTTVAISYVGATALLSGPLGVDIQVAIPIAYVSAAVLHFTLQRYFVFHDAGAFALAIHHQIGRYVAIGLTQYGLTAVTTAALPALFGIPDLVAYLLATVAFSVTAFFVLRGGVFQPAPVESPAGDSR